MHCRLHGRIVFLKRRRPQHENRKTTKERKIHNRTSADRSTKNSLTPKARNRFAVIKKELPAQTGNSLYQVIYKPENTTKCRLLSHV